MINFLRRRNHFTKIGYLGIIFLILGIGLSFVDTIWAVYLYSFFKSDVLVGLISSVFTFFSLIGYIYLIPVVEKNKKLVLFKFALFATAICYFIFYFVRNVYVIILLGIILSLISVIRIDTWGIIIEKSSKKEELSRNEGFLYTIMNSGWLIGPLIAGPISEKFNIPIIFILAGILLISAGILLITSKLKIKDTILKRGDRNFLRNIEDFLKNKDLVKNYIISGSPSLWWAFIFVYVPIYLLRRGLGLEWIAYFLFAVIIPLVIFEYYFSRKAEDFGFKNLFVIGHALLATILFFCFFIQEVYFLIILLILGGIGIAMIEATSETYFFRIAPNKGKVKYYAVYNTTLDVFNLIGKLFVAGILAIMTFKYSFLMLALVFIFLTFVAMSMKEVSLKKE